MKRILALFLILLSMPATATDLRGPRNRSSNGKQCMQASIAGVMTDMVCAEGTAGGARLKGRTDGVAAGAGDVGERLVQSRLRSAATSLTTNNPLNVLATPLTLTAGNWDLYGVIGFTPGSGTAFTILHSAISLTSGALPASGDTIGVQNANGEIRAFFNTASMVPPNDPLLLVTRSQISISASTTFYLVAQATFTVSGLITYGSLTAVRMP